MDERRGKRPWYLRWCWIAIYSGLLMLVASMNLIGLLARTDDDAAIVPLMGLGVALLITGMARIVTEPTQE